MRSMSAVAMLICCCAMLQLTAHLSSAVPEMTAGKARTAGLLGGSRDKRSVFNLPNAVLHPKHAGASLALDWPPRTVTDTISKAGTAPSACASAHCLAAVGSDRLSPDNMLCGIRLQF
uniref:Secreted protein n=1 Tax=Macrostomum lignano TaxID=282301 RepID=A0A1I8FBK7_9PLAT